MNISWMRQLPFAAGACLMLAGCAASPKGDAKQSGAAKSKPVRRVEAVGSIYGFLTLPGAEGEYPTVIMSHGFGGSADDFSIYVKCLAENGIATYCYDFRGARQTTRSKGLTTREMTILTEEEDLEAVIEGVRGMAGVKKDAVCLFGGSMGGLVSALVADKTQWQSKVAALVLLYPAFCVEKDWTVKFPDDDNIPTAIDNFPFPGAALGKVFITTTKTLDTFNHIGHYAGPVLIMHGTLDAIAHMEDSERAAELYPNATLKKFAGERHGFSAAGDTEAAKMTAKFIADARI